MLNWDDNGRAFHAHTESINLKWVWVYDVSTHPNRKFTLREYRSNDNYDVVRPEVEAHCDAQD
jgi:hypothetical protein